MKHEGLDKRRYIRIGTSLLVSYTVLDAQGEHKELITKDVSGGGIRLPLKERLSVGTMLKVQLELLKEKKRISLEAKVIWIKPTLDDKEYSYEAGLEFINLDLAQRAMISNCVQYLNRGELLKWFFLKGDAFPANRESTPN